MKNWPNDLFIDGEFRAPEGGHRTRLINPATDEAVAEIAAASERQAGEAIESAHRAWEREWRDLKPGRRAEILFRVAALIRERLEEIAQAESQTIGKPISDARDETALGARVFEYYAGAISHLCGQTIPIARGGLDFTLRQSMGVVAAIAPWNFPFPIGCWKTAPALAAGNAVVLKPASLSPVTALMLGQICFEAGVPAGVLQVLPGSGAKLSEELTSHRRVRKISFTGSTEVGAQIMASAAAGIKRVSLELGGKSPNIVFADADLTQAAESSPMSVFANTGQDCCARSRIFVEERIYDEFVNRFVRATGGLRVDQPSKAETQVGPLVSKQQRENVEKFIEAARGKGREIAVGGGRPFEKGAFLAPTVVLQADPGDSFWKEEIFGPVVCIRPFRDEAAMLREVNDTPYGLSGSIWTNDLKRAIRVARRVESGVLSINSHSSVHVEAPFGGFKQSGLGRDLGMAALEGYTEVKNIYVAD